MSKAQVVLRYQNSNIKCMSFMHELAVDITVDDDQQRYFTGLRHENYIRLRELCREVLGPYGQRWTTDTFYACSIGFRTRNEALQIKLAFQPED